MTERVLLFLLLGFTGGGFGILGALLFGVTAWLDARLFILLGTAGGLALAAALAPKPTRPGAEEE